MTCVAVGFVHTLFPACGGKSRLNRTPSKNVTVSSQPLLRPRSRTQRCHHFGLMLAVLGRQGPKALASQTVTSKLLDVVRLLDSFGSKPKILEESLINNCAMIYLLYSHSSSCPWFRRSTSSPFWHGIFPKTDFKVESLSLKSELGISKRPHHSRSIQIPPRRYIMNVSDRFFFDSERAKSR